MTGSLEMGHISNLVVMDKSATLYTVDHMILLDKLKRQVVCAVLLYGRCQTFGNHCTLYVQITNTTLVQSSYHAEYLEAQFWAQAVYQVILSLILHTERSSCKSLSLH